eukprot:91808-Rhodomonas_salina.1
MCYVDKKKRGYVSDVWTRTTETYLEDDALEDEGVAVLGLWYRHTPSLLRYPLVTTEYVHTDQNA